MSRCLNTYKSLYYIESNELHVMMSGNYNEASTFHLNPKHIISSPTVSALISFVFHSGVAASPPS